MPPRRWTTDELDTANKMLSDGASFAEIGKTIDRSGAAVEAKLKGQGAQRTAAAKKKPKPEAQPVVEVESTETKGTIVEENQSPLNLKKLNQNPRRDQMTMSKRAQRSNTSLAQ